MDINIDELQKICLDFFRLAGMGFSLWDENMHNIFSYPKAHCPFCEYVRTDEKLADKCAISDSIGLEEVNRTKNPFVYTCHMGLTEAIVPIMQDEEIVGYLMMGQIVEEINRSNIGKCIERSSYNECFKQALRDRLSENVLSDSERISYCINVLKVMIDYMNLSYVIKKSNESVYSKAKRYISDNISKQILPKDICRAIGVSENTLYKSIKRRKGISPTQLIRNIKIEQAKILLKKSDESITRIAENIGIPDVNYFIRVFKSENGMSPLKYRKTINGQRS